VFSQTDAISSDNGTIPAILKYRYDRGIVGDLFNGINPNFANYFEATSSDDSYYRPSFQGGIGQNGQDEINTLPLWVKAEIDTDWIFKTKFRNNGGTAACPIFESVVTVNALITIPQPVSLAPAYDTARTPLAPFYGISRDNIGILGDNWRLGTYGDVSVFTDPNNGQFVNLANNIGNATEKSAATNVGTFPFAIPCNVVIPIQSNTRTYGPWYRTIDGLNGKVHSEKDDGLVPWEYGGSKFMNLSVDAKISNIIMAQQTNERGSVTVAGYPTKQLGVSLDVNPNYIDNGNNAGNGQTPTPRELQNGSYSNECNSFGYFYIDTNTKDDENSKAQISDLQVSVAGQGITTTYTLSAFTPIFGRFTKNNAERQTQLTPLVLMQEVPHYY
jgi:hypothetical protein